MPLKKPYRNARHRWSNMLAYAFIIVSNQKSNKYRTTRENISRVMNVGVMILCKSVTANLLTVVGLLVDLSTSIVKPKVSLESYLSIRQPIITLTSSNNVIYPSLSSFLFLRIMIESNSRSYHSIGKRRSNVGIYVGNSADLCVRRIRTGKMNYTENRNCISFIDLVKERYVIFRGPSISRKRIFEEIQSKSFQELSDIDKILIVISLNSITK